MAGCVGFGCLVLCVSFCIDMRGFHNIIIWVIDTCVKFLSLFSFQCYVLSFRYMVTYLKLTSVYAYKYTYVHRHTHSPPLLFFLSSLTHADFTKVQINK